MREVLNEKQICSTAMLQYTACNSITTISSRRLVMFDAARVCGLGFKCSSFADTERASLPSGSGSSYEDAVRTLNKLQSNAATIQKSIDRQHNNIADTEKYLQRSGISLSDLNKLSVIHISGTKGKGSTCALTESILRTFGVKTGLFSSPHLISVTERFRVNGNPIAREVFSRHFWKVYNALDQQKDDENDMPPYFKFLTVLCFHIFFENKVDVAILEVGIGGENDCTNIVRNTKTVGITSLGLEHTRLLGNTIEEIAWQKAGIIKPHSNVFTSPQPQECLQILERRANEKNAKVFVTPNFAEYKWLVPPKLQMKIKVQETNASLAIQLAYDWLKQSKWTQINGLLKKLNEGSVNLEACDKTIRGIESCFWPGRGQVIKFQNKTFYLDGAHTKESLQICLDWFMMATKENNVPNILIFNATGDRNSMQLLSLINEFRELYNIALFVPNLPFNVAQQNLDNTSAWSHQEQISRAKDHQKIWLNLSPENKSKCFGSILEALLFTHHQYNSNCNILITGSIHLIGATLQALESLDREISV